MEETGSQNPINNLFKQMSGMTNNSNNFQNNQQMQQGNDPK